MGGLDKGNKLPRDVEIMYERLPEELKQEVDKLPSEKMVSVLQALNRFHHIMEAEVYELALRLIRAAR